MRLTTITLSGFKSFAQKTVIDVRKNITGIVGPNGSGKSNIAEAIRFVLGEQSMKSMRTSGGSDLIFKGSTGSTSLPALSRASVSLTLSNKDKEITHEVGERIAPFLAYDEIILSREVFADGGSDYTINGAKVRLKDVEELLALAGIGNNKHTVLSQGEADKILLVTPKERKTLIEDALGLKVFQIRIDESRKKLEKTHRHLDEVKALQREAKPHFSYLERQLEKIKKFTEEKERFKGHSRFFFSEETKRLAKVKEDIKEIGSASALELLHTTLEKDLRSLIEKGERVFDTKDIDRRILQKRNELSSLDYAVREKSISIELLKRERSYVVSEIQKIERGEIISYSEDERLSFRSEIFTHLDSMKNAHDGQEIISFHDEYDKSKLKLNQFLKSDNKKNEKLEKLIAEEKKKESDSAYLQKEKIEVETSLEKVRGELSLLEKEREAGKEHFAKEEKRLYIMRTKSAELKGMIGTQREKERGYENDKRYLESLLEEAKLFLGDEVREYPYYLGGNRDDIYNRYEAQRLFEKSKLRLEEGNVSGEKEIESEYKKARERMEYLQREIEAIVASEKDLEILITEVEEYMRKKYDDGIQKVSLSFSKYFQTVFKGGEASLIHKEYETASDEDESTVKERGVDIAVSLPQKKVKNIAAFSGGEKALTSIALLFALAEVSPPPFIVLDETDAPLDEHNAKKYGETLALLSEKSKLLVITHNRETMSHCEMLYGVTIGMDGASKLLSVDLK